MTTELQHVVDAAFELPARQRVALARLLVPDDPEIDAEWERLFAASVETLDSMADRLWADHLAGLTEPLDPDEL